MLVSVVIPTFNADRFLLKAIQSVLGQTHADLELIVVDDGSTDSTAETLAEIDDPRFHSISQSNQGVALARNRGLDLSSGTLVAFLDADDYWFPEKLQIQTREISRQHDCVAVGAFMRYESPSGTVLGRAGQDIGPEHQELIREGRLMPFPISAALFSAEAAEAIGGFDESLSKTIPGQVEDVDFVARISALGMVRMVPQELGAYLIHANSASARYLASQRAGTRFVRARLRARSRNEDLAWEEFLDTYRPTFRQRYGDVVQANYRRTGQAVAEKDWGRAFRSGLISLLLGPRYTARRFMRQRMPRKNP